MDKQEKIAWNTNEAIMWLENEESLYLSTKECKNPGQIKALWKCLRPTNEVKISFVDWNEVFNVTRI